MDRVCLHSLLQPTFLVLNNFSKLSKWKIVSEYAAIHSKLSTTAVFDWVFHALCECLLELFRIYDEISNFRFDFSFMADKFFSNATHLSVGNAFFFKPRTLTYLDITIFCQIILTEWKNATYNGGAKYVLIGGKHTNWIIVALSAVPEHQVLSVVAKG